jgi:hypothetical protein
MGQRQEIDEDNFGEACDPDLGPGVSRMAMRGGSSCRVPFMPVNSRIPSNPHDSQD